MTARTMMLVALSLLMACREGAVPADQPATVPAAAPAPAVVAPPAPVEPTFTDSTWSADGTIVAWAVRFSASDSVELWLGHRDGGQDTRLATARSAEDDSGLYYEDLAFTLDGSLLYFRQPAYYNSSEVVAVDLETLEFMELETSALELHSIPRGEFAGMFVLLQLRPVEDMGRLPQYWLYNEGMEPIRKIADEDGYDAWAAKHIPPR